MSIDPETGEVLENAGRRSPAQPGGGESLQNKDAPATTAQRAVPRIRTLDQLIARASGGEYREEMESIIAGFFADLLHYAQTHADEVKHAKGKLSVEITAMVDRFGDVALEIKDKVQLPDPPSIGGTARLHIEPATGTLVAHPQYDAPLLRDVEKRGGQLRR